MKNFIKKIYGVMWSHEFVYHSQELESEMKEDEDGWGYDHGVIDANTNRVLIKAGIPSDRQELSLLHEHIHLIEYENLIELSHQDVKTLAAGLYHIGYRLPMEKDTKDDK